MTGFITKNELTQDLVREIENQALATIDKAGAVKPDGTTITIDADGKISAKQGGGIAFTEEEKEKLDGIAENANNYALPTATNTVLGGVKVDGTTITINSEGVIEASAQTTPTVTIKNDTMQVTTKVEDQVDLPIDLAGFNPNSSSYSIFRNSTKVPKTEFTIKPVSEGDLTKGYSAVLEDSAKPIPIGTFFEIEVNSIVVA